MRSFLCHDCGIDTLEALEFYMVDFDLWREAFPKRKGLLCIGCLERRLGRELTPADFIDAPVNRDPPRCYSARLNARLGR